jgi:multiple sugar transport system permease protein
MTQVDIAKGYGEADDGANGRRPGDRPVLPRRTSARRLSGRAKRGGKPFRDDRPGYRRKVILWLVGPAVVVQVLVYLVPIIVGIYTSFTGITFSTLRDWVDAPFLGFHNYKLILATPAIADPLLHSFLLSLVYVTIVVTCSIMLGMLAVIMVRSLARGGRFVQIIYILPFTVPVYAGVLTWDFVFQGHGAATALLATDLHLVSSNTLWLEGTNAFWSMVIATIWRSWPFAFLMLLAASQQIPDALYEAVRVDGGAHWKEARYVTLPLLRTTTVTLSLILFLWTFNDFTTPFVFFGQIPPQDADLFPLHVYTNAFVNASYSLGDAMTLIAVIALLVVAVPYSRLSGIVGRDEA